MTKAVIFANGDVLDGPMVRQALAAAESPLVVAADGGAHIAGYYGLKIDAVIGDMDSIDPGTLQTLADSGAAIHRYDPEKDHTDLELALHYVAEQGADWVRIVGGVGSRLDQTLANTYLLALPVVQNIDVRIVADNQEIRLLYPGRHHIEGETGDTISLIPVGGAVYGIQTENLYYPLENETLGFGPARGISNVLDAPQAAITTRDGNLLLIHIIGQPE